MESSPLITEDDDSDDSDDKTNGNIDDDNDNDDNINDNNNYNYDDIDQHDSKHGHNADGTIAERTWEMDGIRSYMFCYIITHLSIAIVYVIVMSMNLKLL